MVDTPLSTVRPRGLQRVPVARIGAHSIARIAVFTALVAVLGLTPAFNVAGLSVPITAQTFAVMLAGLMLLPLEAFLSVGLFVALVAAGLPILSGGRGGLGVFSTASAGFVLGFPFAAAATSIVAGQIRRLGSIRSNAVAVIAAFVAAAIGGIVVLYAIGVPVGSWVADIPFGTFLDGSMTFVPGDLVKAAAAALVATAVFRAAPFLRPPVGRA